MIVKELIKLLSCCDPEAEVIVQVGSNDAYRKACAKLVSEDDGTKDNDGLACLQFMSIDKMEQTQFVYSEKSELLITVGQDYYTDEFFENYVNSGIVNNELKQRYREA